jgi:DNA polymerase III subunit delta'
MTAPDHPPNPRPYCVVPAGERVPLIGHAVLRARLAAAAGRGSLPASVLLHGARGIGKQRLALWLAQALLCTNSAANGETGELVACGQCLSCRYAAELTHPDLRWVFPRPRPKDPDIGAAEVARDYGDAIAERVRDGLLYGPADGTEAIYVSTVRALAHDAAMTPAMSARKVLVIGDAERMVAQEGADAAANALLKLLEEPPADTTIILTSSDPGALLPTVRSRVAAIRVAPLDTPDVAEWLRHPQVRATLDAAGPAASDADRARRARGAPGTLLGETPAAASDRASAIIDAAQSARASAWYRIALQQGAAGARGAFSDVLGALTDQMTGKARAAVEQMDDQAARAACVAVAAVAEAKTRADGNVNPQLLVTGLLRVLRMPVPRRG